MKEIGPCLQPCGLLRRLGFSRATFCGSSQIRGYPYARSRLDCLCTTVRPQGRDAGSLLVTWRKLPKTFQSTSATAVRLWPRSSGTRSQNRRREGCALPLPSRHLLRDMARQFDEHLRQSETSSLEPWHHEIRDYVRSGRVPTLFARDNLAAWARRRGLLTQAPARLGHLATEFLRSKPDQTGSRNR